MRRLNILPFGACFAALYNARNDVVPPLNSASQAAFEELITAHISKNLWPDIGSANFKKRPSVRKWHHYLTLADLVVMEHVMKTRTCFPNIVPIPKLDHLALFQKEDLSATGILESFSIYLPDIDHVQQGALNSLVDSTLTQCDGLLYQLKMKFQRMRPFQAAYLSHLIGFPYLEARSAYSPSLPSGHCFAGMFAACCVFEAHLNSKIMPPLCTDQLERLKQLAVDIGDRRVMAGVHYPTDNIASWYCLALLIPKRFPNRSHEIKEFLSRCIDKSSVWIALKKSSSPLHAHAVKWLGKVV
jgi:hypothetical protein